MSLWGVGECNVHARRVAQLVGGARGSDDPEGARLDVLGKAAAKAP